MRWAFPTVQPVVCQARMRAPVGDNATVKNNHDCKLRQLWHDRLGHTGKTAIERLTIERLCTGLPVSLIPCAQCATHCDSCVRSKQIRPPFPDNSSRPTWILHTLDADTVGELPRTGTGWKRYFLRVVDECCSYSEVIHVHQKSASAQELISVIARWERQCDAN